MMKLAVLVVLTVTMLLAITYAQHRSLKQQQAAKILPNGRSKNRSALQQFSATNPEQASHNLEYSDQPQQLDKSSPPIRDTLDADFAAEAHGFTGFENIGKGSRYKSSNNA